MKSFILRLIERIKLLPKYVLPLILSVLIIAMSIPTLYYTGWLSKKDEGNKISGQQNLSDTATENASSNSSSLSLVAKDKGKQLPDELSKYTKISDNKSVNDLMEQALLKVSESKYDEAIKLLTTAIVMDKPNAKLHYLRGKIYESLGKIEFAISDYKLAIGIDKTFADAYAALAELYYNKDSKDEALQACNDGLAQQPNNTDLIQTRMYIYSDTGEYEKAIKDAEALIRLDPTNPLGYAGLADFLVTYNEYDKVIQNYTTALKYCGDNDTKLKYAIYRQRSLCYYNTDRYREAIDDFKIYYSANEYDENIVYFALSYYYIKDTDNAILWFKRCINKAIEVNMASYYLASIYAVKKDYNSAITYYTTCINGDYNKDNSLYNRGVCYKELNNKEKALADFNACLQVTKDLSLKQTVETAIGELKK